MEKQEAIKYIEERVGFVPHEIIIDLYNDGEDVPQGLIDIECDYWKPPEPLILMVGAKLYAKLKDILPTL